MPEEIGKIVGLKEIRKIEFDKIFIYGFLFFLFSRVFMIQVKHKKRTEAKGLSFYHSNLLCCSDAGSDGVEPAPCFVIQNC